MLRATTLALAWALLVFIGLGGCSLAPRPLSDAELDDVAGARLTAVAAGQEPLTRPLGLYEAMARALKYNLDRRLDAAQGALRRAELDLAHFSLLPSAVASSGFASRDTYSASGSFNLVTNTQNFGASTSQEKDIRTADLAFSWHVLDFGLSWVRARQAGDRVLIAHELQRRVVHRLLEEVRTTYWRAVSHERLVGRLRRLEVRTHAALSRARRLADGRQVSPITALTYERELVEIRRAIKELQRDLLIAKSQLAALINIPPHTGFALAPTVRRPPPPLALPLADMIAIAVRDRPELRDVAFQQRINLHEAQATLLELLPGFQVFASTNYDSNAFLFANQWLSWGSRASWHLLKVFQYPARRAVVDGQAALLETRALALTMAVMTQVSVSRLRYEHFRQEVGVAAAYLDVQRRLLAQIRSEARVDRVSEHTLIREELNTLVAEAKYDIIEVSVQSAFANVFASLGADPYGGAALDRPVAEIANDLRRHWHALLHQPRPASALALVADRSP